jgi:hypothetical protein
MEKVNQRIERGVSLATVAQVLPTLRLSMTCPSPLRLGSRRSQVNTGGLGPVEEGALEGSEIKQTSASIL